MPLHSPLVVGGTRTTAAQRDRLTAYWLAYRQEALDARAVAEHGSDWYRELCGRIDQADCELADLGLSN